MKQEASPDRAGSESHIHKIPKSLKKKREEHWHFDTRYLFSVISDKNLIGLNKDEATDFQWIKISAIIKDKESHLYNVAKKAKDIIDNIKKG
jgi:acyl-CoA thioesterase